MAEGEVKDRKTMLWVAISIAILVFSMVLTIGYILQPELLKPPG